MSTYLPKYGANSTNNSISSLYNFNTSISSSNRFTFGYDPYSEVKNSLPYEFVSAPSEFSILASATTGSSTTNSSAFDLAMIETFVKVFDEFVKDEDEDEVEDKDEVENEDEEDKKASMDQRKAAETLINLNDKDYTKLDKLDGEKDGQIDINVFKSADLEEVLGDKNSELKAAQKYLKDNEDQLELIDEYGFTVGTMGQVELTNESFDKESLKEYVKGLDMLDAAKVLRDEEVWDKLSTDDDVVCYEELKIAAENTDLSKEVRDAAKFFIEEENKNNFNALTDGNNKDCTKDTFDKRIEKLETAYNVEEVEKETEKDEEE